MRRLLLVLFVALVAIVGASGCGGEQVVELSQWTFVRDDGSSAQVTLPTHLDLPDHPTRFLLRAHVPLEPAMRGRQLTLAFLRLPAIASLRANGHRAIALEKDAATWYRVSGAQRWAVADDLTHGESLDLELELEHRSTQSAWIDAVPRLSATDHGDSLFLALHFWNDASAYFGFAVVVAAGVGYSLVWLLDRRRTAHGWFALEAIGGIAFPAFATGLTQPFFGTNDSTIMGLQVALGAVAAVAFVHAYFDLPYARIGKWQLSGRALLVGWLLLCVYGAIVSGPFRTTRWFAPVVAGVVGLSAWTQILLCVQLARKNPRPRNVFLVALAWPIAGVLGTVEIAWWLGLGWIFRGLQGGSAAISTVAFLRIAALGREHLRSLRKADRLNEELARRITTLEDHQREVERLNEELRRQIAARSSQLADALARIGARHSGVVILDIGDTVAGRYRVVKPIASGGMGSVYEVVRAKDGAAFALKVLHGRNEPLALARFAREAQIAAQIHHPNVVSIADVDVDADGYVFIVMELVRGTSLGELRDRYGDAAFALPVLRQIADGLAAIHERGIVHRDLKPANVLVVDPDGAPQAKITDFGIAMLDEQSSQQTPTANDREAPTSRGGRPSDLPTSRGGRASGTVERTERSEVATTLDEIEGPRASTPLTRTGVVMGTPLYMAPELVGGARNARPSSDVFALGVIAYFLLAGEHPFPERRGGEVKATPAPALGAKVSTVSAEVVAVLQACLELDPELRPTARRVAEVLAAARPVSSSQRVATAQ